MGKVIYEDKLMQELRRMRELPDDVRVKVLAAVSRQPAADVAPVVHAEWRKTYTCHGEQAWGYVCNQCKAENPRASYFCPTCGAKMDGGNGYD